MARYKRAAAIDGSDLSVQLGLTGLGLVSLAIGTIGLARAFGSLDHIAGGLAFTGAGILLLAYVTRIRTRQSAEVRSRAPFRPAGWTPPVFPLGPASGTPFPMRSPAASQLAPTETWTTGSILAALGEIDWHQFERFCAALLRTNGYEVVRKGGAQPDGSVDLLAERDGERLLVQCKHGRARVVKENVIHGLLGGMTQYDAARGAVYTLNGWNKPAAVFAARHGLTLVNGGELASRALAHLTPRQLSEILNPALHHSPNCEAPMVCRDGTFHSLWGCSTAPRCQATLKDTRRQ